ncbi:MAG: histidine kinase dimerization/phosphoacceptor domain -containing protein [Prolixibacteraceae bacterium]
MKLILAFYLYIFIATGSLAQQASGMIDSLEIKLSKLRETNPGTETEVYTLIKLSYYSLNDPIKSSIYSREALRQARAIGYKKAEAQALSYLGEAEKLLGNNVQSIDYYLKSIKIFRELNLTYFEANALSSLAKIYSNEGDKLNAKHYFKEAIQRLTEFHDTIYVSSAQLNMGEFYRKFAELDSAIEYYNIALTNLESIKVKSNLKTIEENRATIFGNLGMVFLAQGNPVKAKPNLEQANQYFTDHFEPYRKSVYQCELGKLYILEGKVQKGEALINESLQMAQEAQLKEQIKDFSKELSAFYEQQNQPQKALRFYQQYKLYDDSLKNVENVRKLEQQQSQFQLSRKDEEIEILNKINKLQRILGMGLFAGVLVVIVFIFIVIRANLRIKVINKEITLQKQLVEEREKEKALLLRELNHRVKNNLQMVASLLSLHSRQLKGHPAAEALMEGKYRVEALTLIHQKLYRDDVDTKIDLKDYIEELSQNLVMNFNKDFKLELYLVPFIMKIDKAIPLGLILNELLTNSLKYGKAEGKQPVLKISIQKLPEHVLLIIEDNGTGLPVDFDFKRTDSFGLKLVHSLINQLGGKIDWSSENGTQWTITLNTIKIS